MKRLLGFASCCFLVTIAGLDLVLVVLTLKGPPIICSRRQYKILLFFQK